MKPSLIWDLRQCSLQFLRRFGTTVDHVFKVIQYKTLDPWIRFWICCLRSRKQTTNLPYVIRTNKFHTFFFNDLIQIYCFRHVSNIQVFILRKTCTCSFMVLLLRIQNVPSTRLLIWMHERNIIKLHVQVFLRMNTWMFETCQRHYN
jgi:hypothetical protein